MAARPRFTPTARNDPINFVDTTGAKSDHITAEQLKVIMEKIKKKYGPKIEEEIAKRIAEKFGCKLLSGIPASKLARGD